MFQSKKAKDNKNLFKETGYFIKQTFLRNSELTTLLKLMSFEEWTQEMFMQNILQLSQS